MNNPLVSVIIPCYNMGQFIWDAISSVLSQTYQNFEIIVVNDGSTDSTNEIFEGISNDKIKVIHTTKQGLSEARNTGIKNSLGYFILPLDSDDKISEKYLELAVNAFAANPSLKLVYGRANFFGERTGEWKLEKFDFQKLLFYNQIYPCAMYKRDDYDKTQGYDSGMKYGWEDWEFWIALLAKSPNVFFLNEIVFFYRIRNGSMVRSMTEEQKKHLYQRIYCRHAGLYESFFKNPFELYYENRYYKTLYSAPIVRIIIKILLKFKFIRS